MGGAVFPTCSMAWGQTRVAVMVFLVTSFKSTDASILWLPGLLKLVPLILSRALSTHTSTKDSRTLTGKCGSVSRGVTAPFSGSWCTRFSCTLQESVSLGLLSAFAGSPGWEIFVGPRTFAPVQEPLWYNCSPVWGSPALWLCGRDNGASSKRIYATRSASQVPVEGPWDPGLCRRHSHTRGQSGSVSCGFVWALWLPLAGRRFDVKCDCIPPTILLGLLLCPWMQGISFLVGSNILLLMVFQQLVTILVFSQENMSMSFYSAILYVSCIMMPIGWCYPSVLFPSYLSELYLIKEERLGWVELPRGDMQYLWTIFSFLLHIGKGESGTQLEYTSKDFKKLTYKM